jgi:N-acetylglucosaminyl-diphospho-decaprenol L-rhamnosyltransferase
VPVAPAIRAVVVSWDGAHLLPPCLDSLEAQTVRGDMEIVVVDNASSDGTQAMLAARYPTVDRLASARNLGFAGGAALGTRGFTGDYLVFLNNDAVFAPDAVEIMRAALSAVDGGDVAAVTAKILLDRPGTPGDASLVNSTGNVITPDGTGADRDWLSPDGAESRDPDVFGFSGGAAMLRRGALEAVGGFDPSLFLYYEDTDLSWRLRAAGWQVRYVPAAVAWHRHAASSGTDSPVFRYYNTRNSLIVFTRHAPLRVVGRSVARQALGVVRAATRHGLRSPLTRARARALRDFAARLPRTLIERRRIWRGSAISRAEVARYLRVRPQD